MNKMESCESLIKALKKLKKSTQYRKHHLYVSISERKITKSISEAAYEHAVHIQYLTTIRRCTFVFFYGVKISKGNTYIQKSFTVNYSLYTKEQ